MVRIGEDVSERLDIVPAEFFVHRHIHGKWACRCCQLLVQEPAAPQVIDGGIPASGLLAHTLISRFVDHLPYYRQEPINARSGVHTPRSTLAAWAGQAGAELEPLYEAHRRFVLGCAGAARRRDAGGAAGPRRGQDEEGLHLGLRARRLRARAGRGLRLLRRARRRSTRWRSSKGWTRHAGGDDYSGYDAVLSSWTGAAAADCLAHARRKFDELVKASASAVAGRRSGASPGSTGSRPTRRS